MCFKKLKESITQKMRTHYGFNKETAWLWWLKILIPFFTLIGLALLILHFKNSQYHPELGIFFTMFFTIVAGVVVQYMWKTHENRINAENIFNFMYEQLELNTRKYLTCTTILKESKEPIILIDAKPLLDCVKIWEDNQDKYYSVFVKHPYFKDELKEIIFLAFVEIYLELRLVIQRVNEISWAIDKYIATIHATISQMAQDSVKEQIQSVLDMFNKQIQDSFDNSKEQISTAKPRLEYCNTVILDFKSRFFSKPFDIKKHDTKAKALYMAYKDLVGFKQKT